MVSPTSARDEIAPVRLRTTNQCSIKQYGRISKAIPPLATRKTSKDIKSTAQTQTQATEASKHASHAPKRKRDDSEDVPEDSTNKLEQASKKAKADTQHPATPIKSRSNPQDLPTPDLTPSKPQSPRRLLATPTRGQQRLTDIKALAASAQERQNQTLASNVPDSPSNRKSKALQSRSMLLYDRLKAKADERAKAPPPLSADGIARKNALQRLPDVARVLALPPAKKTQARASYSLKAMVERVQQSARSPMGAAEVERCLRLLADEAERLKAVGFVSFSRMGKTEAVTVDARYRLLDIEKRAVQVAEEVV